MSTAHDGRVESGSFRLSAPVDVFPGGCPMCAAPVLWALSGRESPYRVLLVPDSGARLSVESGRAVVVASAAGQLEVADAWIYRLHVCDPSVITNEIGYYTAVVLSHPCPVSSCSSPPGELCVSPRYEVLPRPHGARVAVATDQPWTDDDQLAPTMHDE